MVSIDYSPHQILQITDEAIDIAFARRLVYDVLIIVIAQTAAQFLVVHLGLVFAYAPATRHLSDNRCNKHNI